METSKTGAAIPIEFNPDLDFKESLARNVGLSFEKCFQCGTCSTTCSLSPDDAPFPRKEMAWAAWGLKDHLTSDPDIWLCYQCNDCSTRCPRGARPGDLLSSARQQAALRYALFPTVGRLFSRSSSILLLLAVPAILLAAGFLLKEPIEQALGISVSMGEQIHYSYSSVFPHWFLNSLFGLVTLFVILSFMVGARRLWNGFSVHYSNPGVNPGGSLWSATVTVFKRIFLHENFSECTRSHSRHLSHMMVFFGFLSLTAVTIWVITLSINPIAGTYLIYPFGFWHPWKLLANVGGLALFLGTGLMIKDRLIGDDKAESHSYTDWFLLVTLFFVIASGFATEALHFVRLEPHRHIVYFFHLVFVMVLFVGLPFTKLSHVVYRTVALIYAEYNGRVLKTAGETEVVLARSEGSGIDQAGEVETSAVAES